VYVNALFSFPRFSTSLLDALDDLHVDDSHGRIPHFFARHDYKSQSATTISPSSLASLVPNYGFRSLYAYVLPRQPNGLRVFSEYSLHSPR
jgi:hypothetical protein